MHKSLFGVLAAGILIALAPLSATAANSSTKMMPMCRGMMVWAIPSSRVYVRKGNVHYGMRSTHGMYLCEAAARAKGYRLISNAMMMPHHVLHTTPNATPMPNPNGNLNAAPGATPNPMNNENGVHTTAAPPGTPAPALK